ncbi:hypothetical protein HY338_00820 [Candidatus Gottesmanbacteria bacterium]|nr:hypothetical protein [Candidatus Gottesmanbacteria bacterium]
MFGEGNNFENGFHAYKTFAINFKSITYFTLPADRRNIIISKEFFLLYKPEIETDKKEIIVTYVPLGFLAEQDFIR